MDIDKAYDVADAMLVAMEHYGVESEEEFFAVMSCLFRRKHKELERERENWESGNER